MSQTSLTPQVLTFLSELSENNNREWFQRNKKRYEKEVRDRFLSFIGAFSPRLRKISPYFKADPRPVGGSMFRIYRDLRFSKDKTPYKTYLAARFPHVEPKGCSAPGFYLSIQSDGGYGASGVWQPDSETLKRIRETIASKTADWKKIAQKVPIEGERLKNPPRGFDAQHPLVEDLKLKDFVTSVRFSAEDIGSEDFLDRFTRTCRRMSPLVKFLCRTLKLNF